MTIRDNSIGSPGVGRTLSPSRIADREIADAPVLSGGGPPSVPSRISVVLLVEEAKAGALHDRSVHMMIKLYGRWLT